jgi:hypothetical protein
MKSFLQDPSVAVLSRKLKPEERLLLAVLEYAYWDLQSGDPGRHSAALNFFLEERESHAFSFVCICQHFSWSPTSIRGQLRPLLDPKRLPSSVAAGA